MAANQFKPVLRKRFGQRVQPDTGLRGDSVVITINIYDAIEPRHVQDRAGIAVVAGGCRSARTLRPNRQSDVALAIQSSQD